MDSPVVSSLLPVVLLIGAGYVAGRRGWVGGGAIRDLSNLIFLLLAPALLFRAMSTVHVEQLRLRPVAAYFVAAGMIFAATVVWRGFNRRAIVLALANTYSNTVMIGIALVGLAYGPEGMVVLLTLISLHSLVLLTSATMVLELAVAHENASQSGAARPPMARTLWRAFYSSLVHPVVLPIFAGLAFAQTGWQLPEVIDKPILLLGQAFTPVALVMVGITLAFTRVGVALARRAGSGGGQEPGASGAGGGARAGLRAARPSAHGDGGGRVAADRGERVSFFAALQDGGRAGDREHGGVDLARAGHRVGGDVAGRSALRPLRARAVP